MKRTFTPKAVLLLGITTVAAVAPLPAQLLYNNGQTIHISPNTTLTVQGDIRNKGTIHNAAPASSMPGDATIAVSGSFLNEGFLFNYGVIALAGNWENLAAYHEGNGTLVLNGTGPQTLRHGGQSFYALVLDGAGEKKLEDNATVTGRISLQRGLLTPAAESVLLLQDGVTVEGGSAGSYVNGRLFHQGSGYKFYPVGKNGVYAPLTFEDILGASPVTGFEVFTPNPYRSVEAGLGRVSAARYWQRTQLSGSVAEAKVGLHLDASDGLPSLDSVVVAEANDAGSPFRSLGRGATSGTASGGVVSSRETITGNVFAVGVSSPGAEKGLFFIPNAFAPASPNDEEKALKIYGSPFTGSGFVFSVYDRWGNQVFESRSATEMTEKGWEGNSRHTGQPLTGGVYTYLVRGKLADGRPLQKAGTITLIR